MQKIVWRIFTQCGKHGGFCHYDNEWERLTEIRKAITEPSDNPNQKYFHLLNPIVIAAKGDVPEIAYDYLYIRKPDLGELHLGDIDFYLETKIYKDLKDSLLNGMVIPGARVYDRKDLDMIELFDSEINVLAYVSTKEMTEKVRIKQSEATRL